MHLHHEVINELKVSFRENFESILANKLQKNEFILNVIKKISDEIITLFEKNSKTVMHLLETNEKIQNELFGTDFFGHLTEKVSDHDQVLELVIKKLRENLCFEQVMQIHCIFIHRMYDHLKDTQFTSNSNNASKEELVKLIFNNVSFGDRGRIEQNGIQKMTNRAGINRNRFFINKSAKVTPHLSAMNKYSPNRHCKYWQETVTHRLPFVSGISGHAGSFLLLGKLFHLDDEEIRYYMLAAFAFLAQGGNHSFHEVMNVAKSLGLPVDYDNYAASVPREFTNSELYQELSDNFPQFLSATS